MLVWALAIIGGKILRSTWHWDHCSEYVADERDMTNTTVPKGTGQAEWLLHNDLKTFFFFFQFFLVPSGECTLPVAFPNLTCQQHSIPFPLYCYSNKPCHHGYSKINAKTCKIHWQFNNKKTSVTMVTVDECKTSHQLVGGKALRTWTDVVQVLLVSQSLQVLLLGRKQKHTRVSFRPAR